MKNLLDNKPLNLISLDLLKKGIAIAIIIRILTEFQFLEYFWSINGIAYGSNESYFGNFLGKYLDFLYTNTWTIKIILLSNLFFCILLAYGYWFRLACLWLIVFNTSLQLRMPDLQDGGDNLINIFLIFLLFTINKNEGNKITNKLRIYLHNLSVVTMGFQIIVVYITTGYFKAQGEDWYSGLAMYYISQVDWISLPYLKLVFQNEYLTTLISYLTIFFQCTFPVAIFSRFKYFWLIIGILFHISIAMYMGLLTFAIVMIFADLFFISDNEWKVFEENKNQLLVKIFKLISRREKNA